MTASAGVCRDSASNTAAELRPWPRSSPARRPPALGHVAALVDGGRRRRAEGVGEGVQGECRVAEQTDVDLLEPADGGVVVVDLDDGLVGRDPGVVGERGAGHDEQVAGVHQPAGDRGPAAAEHPGAERMRVGHEALRAEGGEHRRPQPFGQRPHLLPGPRGAVADDEHRPAGSAQQLRGPFHVGAGRQDPPLGEAALGPVRLGPRADNLDLVGQHQVGDPAAVEGVLDREGGEFGVVGARLHRRGGHGHVAEDRGQVQVLEGAAAEHLRRHLSGDRDHRGAVELGVVQAGEQVRRAWAGYGEADRRTAGQLSIGARGERGRALVPDADVGEFAAGLGPTQRVGEPQVGVADHAEHVPHAPGDQRLHQDVADRAYLCPWRRQLHVAGVGPFVDLVGGGRVGEARRRFAGGRVVVVAVPGAAQPSVLDRPLAQRPALVWAAVLQRRQPAAATGQRDATAVHHRGAYATVRREVGRFEPVPAVGGRTRAVSRGRGRARAHRGRLSMRRGNRRRTKGKEEE
jgi:hypothetical protein